MTRTLSKSDFKLAQSCVTKLYYRENRYPETNDDNPYLAMLAEGGYMVEQLARLMFPDGVELQYGRDVAADWEETRRLLEQDHVTLFEATLLSGRKQARVDILVKRGNHFDLIEVKSKSMDGDDLDEGPLGPFRGKQKPYAIRAPWRPYLEDVGYQTQLLRELYPDAVVVPHLLVVDKSKTTATEGLPGMFSIQRNVMVGGRIKDLDVRFTGDPAAIVPGEFLTIRDVSSEVDELMPEISASTQRLVALYDGDAVQREQEPISWHCRACEYRITGDNERNGFRECWGELATPDPHIFDLWHFGSVKIDGEQLGSQLIANGKTSLYDVPPSLLTSKRSGRQLVQIEYSRGTDPWIGPGLAPALADLQWPLHFIDFETSMLALPYHRDMHPYEQVAFQWSCHTLRGPGQPARTPRVVEHGGLVAERQVPGRAARCRGRRRRDPHLVRVRRECLPADSLAARALQACRTVADCLARRGTRPHRGSPQALRRELLPPGDEGPHVDQGGARRALEGRCATARSLRRMDAAAG